MSVARVTGWRGELHASPQAPCRRHLLAQADQRHHPGRPQWQPPPDGGGRLPRPVVARERRSHRSKRQRVAPFGPDILNGVAVLSSTNAWAVGSYFNGVADRTLIVHWNGSVRKVVASPNVGGPSRENFLTGVAAMSGHNIWAVGSHDNGTADRTLIMHWNGSVWRIAASSNRGGPASENILTGVAAASASDVWAVGKYYDGAGFQTLIEHWNGTSWAVASPNPGGHENNNVLNGVTALSTSNAWAVGYYDSAAIPAQTLALHWS
jgi:hypothetical protein